MKQPIAYDDAISLLDADHKAVKKMFMAYGALCEGDSSPDQKSVLAQRICKALTVHAQIEEEIFYPPVRMAIGDDTLMREALAEHAEAKQIIARIEAMQATNRAYDSTVKQLGALVDQHVLKEREQIFLRASRAALDLRGMTLPLYKRQQQLTKQAAAALAKEPA